MGLSSPIFLVVCGRRVFRSLLPLSTSLDALSSFFVAGRLQAALRFVLVTTVDAAYMSTARLATSFEKKTVFATVHAFSGAVVTVLCSICDATTRLKRVLGLFFLRTAFKAGSSIHCRVDGVHNGPRRHIGVLPQLVDVRGVVFIDGESFLQLLYGLVHFHRFSIFDFFAW